MLARGRMRDVLLIFLLLLAHQSEEQSSPGEAAITSGDRTVVELAENASERLTALAQVVEVVRLRASPRAVFLDASDSSWPVAG